MSDLKGIEISDVLGLSQPLTKLIETVSCGIGKLYEPMYIRKMAKAKSEEIKLISDAMEESLVIPTQYSNGELSLNNNDWNEFVKRTQGRMAFQELQKQNNIENVVSQAYEMLENTEICSQEPVEQGWVNRFFDSVATISDEDLQKLWSKVLAGEILQSKSYSLRTLETLKNLSKQEAELFQKIAPFIVVASGNHFLTSKTEILKKYGIEYAEIMHLDECGLINSSGLISLNSPVSNDNPIGIRTNEKLILVRGVKSEKIKISIGEFALTNAGVELYNLLNSIANDEYLYDFAEEIERKNAQKVKVSIHKINFIDEAKIDYDEEALREYPAISEKQKVESEQ